MFWPSRQVFESECEASALHKNLMPQRISALDESESSVSIKKHLCKLYDVIDRQAVK